MKWIHRLLNPHCEHCAEERREASHSELVDVLKMQLALKTQECQMLMDRLLNPSVPSIPIVEPVEMTRPTRTATWNMRRQMLEEQDRIKARLEKAAPKPSTDVAQLEKELGVENAL